MYGHGVLTGVVQVILIAVEQVQGTVSGFRVSLLLAQYFAESVKCTARSVRKAVSDIPHTFEFELRVLFQRN